MEARPQCSQGGATPLQATNTSEVFYTASEAATILRVSKVTLARWRIEGFGPPFRKFGRRVVYARGELLSWADAQGRTSTSDTSFRRHDSR
jgi:hypothetical protein